MRFKNTVYTEIYDRSGKLIRKIQDNNLVVNQGKEIVRDCLITTVKASGNNGLRNIKLSTNYTIPTVSDTSLGGTEYDAGLQGDEGEKNLETGMYFATDTLEHDQLNIPYRWNNTTGNEVALRKIGVFDYNNDSQRLFGVLLLDDSAGVIVPDGGFTLSRYEITIEKGENDDGYLTDWGIKAINHALVYDNTDYNLNYTGLGTYKDITPTFTTYTSGTFTISASSDNGTNYPWEAFDDKPPSLPTSWRATTSNTGWLQVDCGVNKNITAYSLDIGATILNYNVENWTFEGSNTGVFGGEETIIDTQVGINWSVTGKKYFSFSNVSFRYYRINITKTGNGLTPIISEMELLGFPETESINGLFATTQATSILASETNKILTSFDYTDSGGHQVEEVGVMNVSEDIMPAMTSDVLPSPYIITGTFASPWQLFNNNFTDVGGSIQSTTANVKIDMNIPNLVNAVVIYPRPGVVDRTIRDWTFEGSNDDSDWDVLDIRVDIDFIDGVSQTFVFSNSTKYRYYKLDVTDNNGSTYTNISEIELLNMSLFSKFAHSKTLSDTEQWVDTVDNIVEWE